MYHARAFVIAGVLLAGCARVSIYPAAQANTGTSSTSAQVADAAVAPAPVADSANRAPTAKTDMKPAPMIMRKGEPACPPITKAIADAGKKIFISTGNCSTCHGQNAKGTPLAPDLTDKTWLQIDGSYDAIVKLIHTGVPKPKQHPAPMPPMGGANLTDAQDCTVGAYVYSLSHPIP